MLHLVIGLRRSFSLRPSVRLLALTALVTLVFIFILIGRWPPTSGSSAEPFMQRLDRIERRACVTKRYVKLLRDGQFREHHAQGARRMRRNDLHHARGRHSCNRRRSYFNDDLARADFWVT